MKHKNNSRNSWIFLGAVIIAYALAAWFYPDQVIPSLGKTLHISITILPALVTVLVLMVFTNYFLDDKLLVKHLGKNSGLKGWVFSIIGGMLSSGSIFIWLPLLGELQEKGVKDAFLASFLYTRAIKLPLLPILVSYMGLKYAIVLTVVMVFASIIQGVLTEKIARWHEI